MGPSRRLILRRNCRVIANLYPGTFWAYYVSSAVMQALDPFWQYFVRIEEGMARNCSKDVVAVVDHIDDILLHGSAQDITDLKAKFNLQSVKHNDDFVNQIGYASGLWQEGDESDNHLFLTWCDYIENVNSTIAGPEGVGVEKALDGYARWWKDFGQAISGCPDDDTAAECYDSHNASAPIYTDVSMGLRTNRPYTWLNCATPLGTWQTGAPAGCPSLVSRLIDADYWHRICGLYFPPTPSGETYNQGRTVDDTNAFTGGWNPQNISRVLFVEGEFDPWASAGVTSQFRPGGPMESSENVTVLVLPGGHHCTEQYTPVGGGKAIEDIEKTIDQAVAQIVKWSCIQALDVFGEILAVLKRDRSA
ncbi:unnamed protein product [Zymoseptoria tritici ST99CH_1A5]|uniref:Uncharacterized protein n=1 Tax=Zymoseptoria tritici ST99CH_1A5 TaxID=1276529 RepID=A0A1Y6LFZ6_ZYMTR|nr:unnamed protein product [Zymoseptoria tritici ST99CH_1A5]